MYAYVVKPHPLRDGGFKISKPRGPEGWGIYNFKNPGALRGGGFAFSWGNPNTSQKSMSNICFLSVFINYNYDGT